MASRLRSLERCAWRPGGNTTKKVAKDDLALMTEVLSWLLLRNMNGHEALSGIEALERSSNVNNSASICR